MLPLRDHDGQATATTAADLPRIDARHRGVAAPEDDDTTDPGVVVDAATDDAEEGRP